MRRKENVNIICITAYEDGLFSDVCPWVVWSKSQTVVAVVNKVFHIFRELFSHTNRGVGICLHE